MWITQTKTLHVSTPPRIPQNHVIIVYADERCGGDRGVFMGIFTSTSDGSAFSRMVKGVDHKKWKLTYSITMLDNA